MRRPRWIVAAAIFAAWTLYAIGTAAQSHYIREVMGRPITWGHAFTLDFVESYLWAIATPFVWWMAKRFPLDQRRWYQTVPVHLVNCLAVSAVQQLVREMIIPVETPEWRVHDVGSFTRLLAADLDYNLLLYGTVLLVYYAAEYYTRYEHGRNRASQLEAQLTQAKLQMLRMQLNPHFLFNTLHSISTLVREDADAAEAMIARLSELLRLALETAGSQLIPLHQEVEFAERYLEIERIRFQDRLEIHFDIDPQTLDAEVPNLILQPLIENAVRHGIGEGGTLKVFSRLDGAKLLLQVIDNGGGRGVRVPPPSSGKGLGLANTRARLATIYGKEHDFVLRSASNGGIEAAILIPFRPQRQTGNP